MSYFKGLKQALQTELDMLVDGDSNYTVLRSLVTIEEAERAQSFINSVPVG